MSNDFYIGRQPILNEKGQIDAYELLYRQPGENMANVTDNSTATARVLINAIHNIGLESLLGGKKGFINVDETTIMGGVIDILPKDQFVVEILETTKVTPDVIEKIKEYKKQGYTFALDDMVLSKEYIDTFKCLFELVDIIKIDYMFCDKEQLRKNMAILKKLNVKMLAEKVETQEDYEFCKELGFYFYQGYYFAKPIVITQKSVDPSKVATVQLINMLREDADAHELEKVIKNYQALYINLLKFMNSAAFFTKGNVSSIKHAIALLGRDHLTKWLYLILYAGPNNDSFDNPLLVTAQVRARAMENICKETRLGEQKSGSAYLIGLISLMDVVFNKTIEEIVKELNIEQEIKDAVVNEAGELGKLLRMVKDYEKDDIEAMQKHFNEIGVDVDKFSKIMIESFSYACTISGECN